MKRFGRLYLYVFIAVCAVCCAGCSNSQKQKESPLAPEARMRGEEAAKWLIDAFHGEKSQLRLEGAILHVKALQSEYIMMDDTLAADAFDESFANYIRQNNDSIANLLFD